MILPLRRHGAIPWILLGMILLVAATLRCRHLNRESFWIDEIYSVESALGHGFAHRALPFDTIISRPPPFFDPATAAPWWHIWSACTGKLTGDVHPPLPYMILRGWCGMFGYSEIAIRCLSVLASLTAIILLFLIGRDLHGTTPALWACLIMALAQPQLDYAQEAKHYALLQAMALTACLALVRIEKQGGRPSYFVLLGISAIAMLFTHYFAIPVMMALGLYALLRLRGAVRWHAIIALFMAAFLFGVTWSPSFLAQIRDTSDHVNYFLDRQSGFHLRWLQRLAGACFRLLNEPLPGSDKPAYLFTIICILPLLLIRRRPDLLLWAIWIPFVILFVAAVDLARQTWLLALVRYTLLAGPAIYMVLAALGARLKPPIMRHVLPLFAVLCCAISLPISSGPHKTNFRGFARAISTHAAPGEMIAFCGTDLSKDDLLTYVAGVSYYLRPFPGPVIIVTHSPDAALSTALRSHGRFCVISNGDDLHDLLPDAQIEASRFFPGIGYLLDLRYSPSSAKPFTSASPPPAP